MRVGGASSGGAGVSTCDTAGGSLVCRNHMNLMRSFIVGATECIKMGGKGRREGVQVQLVTNVVLHACVSGQFAKGKREGVERVGVGAKMRGEGVRVCVWGVGCVWIPEWRVDVV